MSGEEAPAESSAVAVGEPMDLMTALQMVLKKSLAHDGLARGLHQGAKVIEKGTAQLCILAEDCDQPDYVKLVRALCADRSTNLITVPSAKTLGEWAGLCKIDSEGKARKVVGCSCVVVQDFGEESEGLHIVKEPSIIICDGPSLRNFGWRSHFNIDVRKMAYANSVSVGGRLGFVNATIDCTSWIKYNPCY